MADNRVNTAAMASDNATEIRKMIESVGVGYGKTKGISMRPLLWSEVCSVGVTPLEKMTDRSEPEPRLGDVLVFEQMRRGEMTAIMHRLIEIRDVTLNGATETIYITRGDNCIGVEHVRRSEIVGVATDFYWNFVKPRWHRCYWMPRLLGAEVEKNCLCMNVDNSRYHLYIKLRNATFPVRRSVRRLRCRLSAITPLRRLYHFLFRR